MVIRPALAIVAAVLLAFVAHVENVAGYAVAVGFMVMGLVLSRSDGWRVPGRAVAWLAFVASLVFIPWMAEPSGPQAAFAMLAIMVQIGSLHQMSRSAPRPTATAYATLLVAGLVVWAGWWIPTLTARNQTAIQDTLSPAGIAALLLAIVAVAGLGALVRASLPPRWTG